MYKHIFATLLVSSVTLAAVPAHAQWKSYVNKELGFSFMAPGEVKASVGNSRGQIAGPRQTIIYRSVADNIEYRVTVISFKQAQAEGATLLGERQATFQDHKKLLADTFSRVGTGKDTVYGRKMVVELPDNKGRATGTFYLTKGRLIALEATVLPARGNAATADVDRFVDSVAFALSSIAPGTAELETPELE